jgi:hypothetical protein
MSEWLKEHAWKLTPAARADAHQISPTQFTPTTSRYNDATSSVPVNEGVYQGFRGLCDTVLTQNLVTLSAIRADVHRYAWACDDSGVQQLLKPLAFIGKLCRDSPNRGAAQGMQPQTPKLTLPSASSRARRNRRVQPLPCPTRPRILSAPQSRFDYRQQHVSDHNECEAAVTSSEPAKVEIAIAPC